MDTPKKRGRPKKIKAEMDTPKKRGRPKKIKAEVVVESVPASIYKATIKVMGKLFEATGQTIKEAVANLSVRNGKGKSILTIEHNGIKREKILQPFVTFRLLNTLGISKEIQVKNISLIFGDL